MSKKTYNGNLNISKNAVSIETDYIYQGIEIDYIGVLNIETTLPSDYIVRKGNNKILIIKLQHNNRNIIDLFTYTGKAIISKCVLVTKELESYNLYINNTALELYDALEGNWEDYTRSWQDISFDGNNKKYNYQYRKANYDKDTKTYTTTKEIRNK